MLPALYRDENAARLARRGFWQDPDFALKDNKSVEGLYNTYQVFEDTLKDAQIVVAQEASERKSNAYLHFAWAGQKGLVAMIAADKLYALSDGNDVASFLEGLKGRRLRLHGWVENHDGARMNLTHAQQIEILPEERRRKAVKPPAP